MSFNSFQITNSVDHPIPLHELDREAAAFWGKQVHETSYATPTVSELGANWFDTIGAAIATPNSHYTTGWSNVKCTLWAVQVIGLGYESEDDQIRHVKDAQYYLKPYFALIDHWAKKGYKPVQI